MAYTYDQLKNMTVVELRKIADGIEHELLKGHSTMHKEKLLPALCTVLGVDIHVHHEVAGVNKTEIKSQIRQLKKERDAALANKESEKQRQIRKQIHVLKRKLRNVIK